MKTWNEMAGKDFIFRGNHLDQNKELSKDGIVASQIAVAIQSRASGFCHNFNELRTPLENIGFILFWRKQKQYLGENIYILYIFSFLPVDKFCGVVIPSN